MNERRQKQIDDLAETLTSEELAYLINQSTDRITVFMGLAGKECMTSELESAIPNGGTVQLNIPAFGPVFQEEEQA